MPPRGRSREPPAVNPHDLLLGAVELTAALVPFLAVIFVGSLAALVRPALRKAARNPSRALPAFHRRRRPF
jgi:hypothetical protein